MELISGIPVLSHKTYKLAGERGELLMPLEEREDSGIDSDGTEQQLQLQLSPQKSSGSSSDEFPAERLWWRLGVLNNGAMKAVTESKPDALAAMPWPRYSNDQKSGSTTPDRSSPPLYEVELTASDEDDDGSVLELVIPMQSRYQRVPTSSPKKPKPKPKVVRRYICSMICCGRK